MTLVVRTGGPGERWWTDHLRSLLPEIECRSWADPGDPDDVLYAVVWEPPAGGLKRFKNLRCIVSIGAGIDHVLRDPELPRHVPVIRTTGDELRVRMREYVSLHVLRLHRRLPELEAARARHEWRRLVSPPAGQRRVGVMGLGNLGADCAQTLAALGFDVAGWARRPKELDGVTTFAGDDQLTAFLARTGILVCLLPLTPATSGILNAGLFARLPEGAMLINCGRGEHLVDQDLLDALDRGHLAAATLDVFREEPLPQAHPFWAHPKILVTPHVASLIDRVTGGRLIADNLRRFINGLPMADRVDLDQGY